MHFALGRHLLSSRAQRAGLASALGSCPCPSPGPARNAPGGPGWRCLLPSYPRRRQNAPSPPSLGEPATPGCVGRGSEPPGAGLGPSLRGQGRSAGSPRLLSPGERPIGEGCPVGRRGARPLSQATQPGIRPASSGPSPDSARLRHFHPPGFSLSSPIPSTPLSLPARPRSSAVCPERTSNTPTPATTPKRGSPWFHGVDLERLPPRGLKTFPNSESETAGCV